MKEIYVNFEGYKWNNYDFPNKSGVYVIYSTYLKDDRRIVGKLNYIGKSNDLKRRILEHGNSDYPIDRKYCYSFCVLNEEETSIVEAALIRKCQPVDNINYKESYPYDEVSIVISGYHKDIPDIITITDENEK